MPKPLIALFLLWCVLSSLLGQSKKEMQRQHALEHYIEQKKATETKMCHPRSAVDTLYTKWGLHINFTEEFAYHYLREKDLVAIEDGVRSALGISKHKRLVITVDNLPIEQYVPVYYSSKGDRHRQDKGTKLQHVRNISKPYSPTLGLPQRHIALWNSHGKYYNHQDSCWKWQRAPLFSTVEDLFTSTYVLPFLVPMLENAGANVYLPRERDIQKHELIVDEKDEGFSLQGEAEQHSLGFQNHVLLDQSSINPFVMGESVLLPKGSRAIWQVAVPQSGAYAVYVAYAAHKKNTKDAHYSVQHAGGESTFIVNQRMGAGTWVYLGHFEFDKEAKVTLIGADKGRTNADAVRFGGGMGSIPREGKISGVPRWQEAARYYLQYAGALDTLTFNRHGDSIDYNDDFRSRARWVNYLMGDKAIEPWIKSKDKIEGLHLPIDVAMGFHTDAGHFNGMDTTVGTLAIYSTYDVDKNRDFYYSKKSRLSNRDLADIVQSQLVNDVRALYDSSWTRREMWDKMYSEATFAQVPSLLFEIHGHANAQDMRYGLHPQFRFDVSRAIYKGCLRFLATYYQQVYVVQPLPVQDMAIVSQGEQLMLQWSPTSDPLEPSAEPQFYVVYRQLDGRGWDNGTRVNEPFYRLPESEGLCAYKVCAVNAGGESFPSTALSVYNVAQAQKNILVIDGFTRVDAPAFMANEDSVGLAPWQDEGVAYGLDIGTIGWQYNYNENDPWVSDDEPGHGGSSFELSDSIFLGNNFNTSLAFVQAIAGEDYKVTSASVAAVEGGQLSLSTYDAVILALGEQRYTLLPSGQEAFDLLSPELILLLEKYLAQGGRLMLDGAHLASSSLEGSDSLRHADFLKEYCGIAFATKVKPVNHRVTFLSDSMSYHYNVAYTSDYYRVENADAFLVQDSAIVLSRYANALPATVFYQNQGRVISSGFPFETIIGEEQRTLLMKRYLNVLFD